MIDSDFASAAAPLFEREVVEAVEWSFDTGWGCTLPDWLPGILQAYSKAGRLYGHGVSYSTLSAEADPRQEQWLERVSRECDALTYQHVSEHLGFMTTPRFARGTPLPMPLHSDVIELGRTRLAALQEACGTRVGLENLALAFSKEECLAQGTLIEQMLPEDGFVLLDLHNAWCQVRNFGIDRAALLASFPLARVRAIHISGGRDDERTGARRDTHDNPIPDAVIEWLPEVIAACENVDVVILERMGGTLVGRTEELVRDFERVQEALA